MNQPVSKLIRETLSSRYAKAAYVGLLCFTLAMLCIILAQHSKYASIWVANAVLLTFIFRSNPKLTWPLYVAGLLANWAANVFAGGSILLALAIAIGNSMEILLPILCVPRKKEKPYLIKGFNHQTNMLVLSLPIGCLLSSTLTIAVQIMANIIPFKLWSADSLSLAFNWFAIDLLAMMAILPLGLSVTLERCRKIMRPSKLIELILVMLTAMALTWISTLYPEIRFVIILMPLLYASFRLGIVGTSLICFSIVSIYIINIMFGIESQPDFPNVVKWISYSFVLMCITLLPALITAILIDQRDDFEDKLRQNEQRFRGAIHYSAIGMSLVTPKGSFMIVNPALCEITGYNEPELMKLNYQDITYPDDRASEAELMKKVAHREIPSFTQEKRCIKKSGEIVWISLVVSAVFDQKHRIAYFITQIENITMRKRMEDALQESEQRWNFALEGGNQGVWDWDLTANKIYFSRTWKMILGYQDHEMTTSLHEWFSRIHPDDEALVAASLNQHIAGASHSFHCEHRIRCKNGQYKWFLGRGKVIARSSTGSGSRVIGTITDIDEIKQIVHELYTEKERLSTTLKAIGDAVIVSDAEGVISFINPIAEQLIGCHADVAVGKHLYETCKITSEFSGELLESPIEACLKSKKTYQHKDGGILTNHVGARYYIQDSAAPIILPSGEVAGCVLVLQDVTLNRNLQTELKHQATHDVLTGLINRRELEIRINSLLTEGHASHTINSLFFIDLDNFKLVNDTAGHAAGDELLRRLAEILSKTVRATDIVARLGGDEFAILLPNCSTSSATNIANNIVRKIKDFNFIWEGKPYTVGTSIGLVSFKTGDITLEEVLSRADIACYTAKNQSGNRVCIFEGNNSDASKLLTEIQMGPQVMKALHEHAFILYAQKIEPLQHEKKIRPYYEVLLRMQDENGNLILPGAFLKSAERQHIITDIDEWVAKKILLDQASEINACHNLIVSINISTTSINSLEFHKTLESILTETTLNKSRIGFELTEAAFANDMDTTLAFLKLIEEHGCFICIDNFGKGLRSFQYLKHFDDIHIKIDGDIIRGIDTNPVGYAIVEAINQLAHKLSARTIAQFVETKSLIDATRKIGIDYAQGYAVHKPEAWSQIIKTLKSNPPDLD